MIKFTNLFILGLVFIFTLNGCKKDNQAIQHDREEVIMRKIGHEVLLLSNDSTSIVRPIVFKNNKYRIQFESNFSFVPDDLVKTIDTIVKTALPYSKYLVQIEECETKQIVYSYEIPYKDAIACKEREQPEACYEIIIQFISKEEKITSLWLYILLPLIFILIRLFFYIKTKRPKNGDKITIGAYLYDKKMMTLSISNVVVDLTSKESELLSLLYNSVNNTVDREIILNKVWGDEGDYIGRTLDVYVSKLRKKLENDTSIQLKNIRGIGYKLIIEE